MTLREHVDYWLQALKLTKEQLGATARRYFLFFAGTEDEDE